MGVEPFWLRLKCSRPACLSRCSQDGRHKLSRSVEMHQVPRPGHRLGVSRAQPRGQSLDRAMEDLRALRSISQRHMPPRRRMRCSRSTAAKPRSRRPRGQPLPGPARSASRPFLSAFSRGKPFARSVANDSAASSSARRSSRRVVAVPSAAIAGRIRAVYADVGSAISRGANPEWSVYPRHPEMNS